MVGSAAAEPARILETFGRLLRRSSGGVVAAFAVVTVGRLVFQTPQWVVAYAQYEALQTGTLSEVGGFTLASICTVLFRIVGEVLAGAVTIGLLRAVRTLALEGPAAAGSGIDILRAAGRRYVHLLAALLLTVLAVAAGALLCFVGALGVLFLVGLAPYLVAAEQMPLGDAAKRSVALARANVPTMAVGVAGLVVLALLAVGLGAGIEALLTALLGSTGVFLGAALSFLVSAALGYVILLFWGAVAVTVVRAGVSR